MNRLIATLLLLFTSGFALAEPVRDEFVEEWFKDKEINSVLPFNDYNYESIKRIKIILTPDEKISTPKNIQVGQKINMHVKRNVSLGDSFLKRGTKAEATVEQFTSNGMTGIQATITLGRIKIEGLPSDKLYYYCMKEGQNRTTWIMPLKWAVTWIPFVGSLTNLIKGGQAKLSPSDDFVVYYYPER